MALVPSGKLTNEAVVQFFRARSRQLALPPLSATERPDVRAFVDIACGYAEAIRLDPRFYQAYNNLGILLKRRELEIRNRSSDLGELPDEAARCFARSGSIESAEPSVLFARALQIRPLPAIEFNAVISEWAGTLDGVRGALDEPLKALLRKDPSLVGAHIILGVIAANRDDLDSAESSFRAALHQDEHFPGLRTNLAQVLRRRDATAEAERLLETARVEQKDAFAGLSLAAMRLERGDDRRAAALLDEILADPRFRVTEPWPVVRTYYDVAAAATLLRAYVDVRAGEDAAAGRRLRAAIEAQRDDENPESAAAEILHIVLAVLHEREGRAATAKQQWKWIAESDRAHGDEILGGAWRILSSRCQPEGESLVPESWRESGRCLGGTPDEALRLVYVAVFDATERLLHHQQVVFAPLG